MTITPGSRGSPAALATPVAGGEYLYGIVPFRHMLEARSVDIVMIDQVRSGGITPWLKIAGMAEAFNLPVVSHGVPEIHVHLVGAAPNGLTVEYMPRLFPLWKEVPDPVNGELAMPTAPASASNSTRPRLTGTARNRKTSPALREREGPCRKASQVQDAAARKRFAPYRGPSSDGERGVIRLRNRFLRFTATLWPGTATCNG